MKAILFWVMVLCSVILTHAQQKETYPANEKALTERIIALDAAAFESYNTCNLEKFKTFFTDDLEFYHDKGGYTTNVNDFIENTRKYICNNPDEKIERKAVAASLKVYPLNEYGAILEGEHQFYIILNNTEKLTGRARFTHLWLLKDGVWKMSRILSYDHGAAK